jgi:hypothetical protein
MLDFDLDHIEAAKKNDRFRAASLRSVPRAGNAFRFVDRGGKLRQPPGALGRRGPFSGLIQARSPDAQLCTQHHVRLVVKRPFRSQNRLTFLQIARY